MATTRRSGACAASNNAMCFLCKSTRCVSKKRAKHCESDKHYRVKVSFDGESKDFCFGCLAFMLPSVLKAAGVNPGADDSPDEDY